MFTKFVMPQGAVLSSVSETQKPQWSSTIVSQPTPDQHHQQQRRRRRSQVARACERCRIHRIKCDTYQPCSNCAKKGEHCSNDGTHASQKSPALPQIYQEAERLKKRVKKLELELQKARELGEADRVQAAQLLSLSSAEFDMGRTTANLGDRNATMVWKGVYVSTRRSAHATWFGPSSLFYFIGRMDACMDSFVQKRVDRKSSALNTASKLLDAAHDATTSEVNRENEQQPEDFDLTPTQEAYFINLFWHSYHTVYPIIDENEFKEHYQSLWTPGVTRRRSSALVDIVLALCIQYGVALLPSSERDLDSSVAMADGYRHYRRCQKLLADEYENPAISTLQCQILSAVYFCAGSQTNMADGACGLAVRTSYMLGLHFDPPESMPRRDQELRRRTWWTLYVLESKMAMKLGRPFLLPHDSDVMCRLPADDHSLAALSSFNFTPWIGECSWLTWTLYNTKLVLAARAAHTAIYSHAPNRMGLVAHERGQSESGDSPELPMVWGDPLTLESYAELLAPYMQSLEDWANSVPDALTLKRKGGKSLLDTDMSSPVDVLLDLQIENFAPLWLQRQRLLLVLMYHNINVNICRPFISFVISPCPTPLADGLAVRSAKHAILLTHIMHQALCSLSSAPSVLAGWHEAFQWQWNAAITLIGFVRAMPHAQPFATFSAARTAIDLAITVLDAFGRTLDVAVTVTDLVRDLAARADVLVPHEHDSAISLPNDDHMLAREASSQGATDISNQPLSDAGVFDYGAEMSAAQMSEQETYSDILINCKNNFHIAGSSSSTTLEEYSSGSDKEYIAAVSQGSFAPSFDSLFAAGQLILGDEDWSLISSLGT
ncbi:hypothetical protein QQS21_004259 [Conoideocrella luteorostrata]|uniref:Zn(2)-C6 fungal-type domain-containing protein n=1 Tax=Conoideocrella luteorostrata TaxID=1105319 RepID=A0AAJ0FUV2_9HYPO|nr:hypothetical protein QQS21_004259 [Conoideocrella luteorostrata]